MADEETSRSEPDAIAIKGKDPVKASLNPNVFFQETKKELSQVSWPSRQQLISESIAVIAMVALSATLVYFLDQLFAWAQTQVFPS